MTTTLLGLSHLILQPMTHCLLSPHIHPPAPPGLGAISFAACEGLGETQPSSSGDSGAIRLGPSQGGLEALFTAWALISNCLLSKTKLVSSTTAMRGQLVSLSGERGRVALQVWLA